MTTAADEREQDAHRGDASGSCRQAGGRRSRTTLLPHGDAVGHDVVVRADLHLHLTGTVPARVMLDEHVRRGEKARWDDYDEQMLAAYGAVPPLREIVARHGAGDPGAAAAFERVFVFGDADAGSFARFSAKTEAMWAVEVDDGEPVEHYRGQVERYAAAIVAEHARQGVDYAEIRMDVKPAEILAPVFAGGTTHRVAVSLSRADPWADWDAVQRLALGAWGDAAVAIDFCGREEDHPPREVAPFLAQVHEFNRQQPDRALAILYHVGESFTDKSLESAVRWVHQAAELGCHRLGHAISLGLDPHSLDPHTRTESATERRDQIDYDLGHADGLETYGIQVNPAALRRERDRLGSEPVRTTYDSERLDDVRRRQDYAIACIEQTASVIEVCPTSNRRIGGITEPAAHPVHRFLAANLHLAVGSDDPGIFGVTLADELDWVQRQHPHRPDLTARLDEQAWSARSPVLTGRPDVPQPGQRRPID